VLRTNVTKPQKTTAKTAIPTGSNSRDRQKKKKKKGFHRDLNPRHKDMADAH
jgi:hypothetical protein